MNEMNLLLPDLHTSKHMHAQQILKNVLLQLQFTAEP